jgi:hypothetical protein
MLLQCAKLGTLVVPYEYESSTIDSLLANVDMLIGNNIAE